MEARHDTVLLAEAVDSLAIVPGETVVDGTVGGAGHFAALHAALGGAGALIGIDADPAALDRARAAVGEGSGVAVRLVNDNFRNLSAVLDAQGLTTIDKSLFDLGWSGFQLAAGRGFSFQSDEPLLMTYGEGAALTAAELVNSATEDELTDILANYGEERFARNIAKAIVKHRSESRILTTKELVDAVLAGTPGWYQRRRVHPATKTFQALRIAVNDEFGALRDALSAALSHTREGGRIAVITFHSIEDRIVKTFFRDAAHEGKGMLVNRKPIVPTPAELAANRRARSAKLRVFSVGCTPLGSSFITHHHHAYVV